MGKVGLIWIYMVVVVMSAANAANAQNAAGSRGNTIGIGYQATWPAHGVSGLLSVGDRLAIQGIVGFIGDLHSYYGRVLYRFGRPADADNRSGPYVYGLGGLFTYSGLRVGDNFVLEETRESVPGFGAGVGYEYRLPDSSPFGFNLEIGYSRVSFDDVDYDFSAIMMGAGMHYYFGGRN